MMPAKANAKVKNNFFIVLMILVNDKVNYLLSFVIDAAKIANSVPRFFKYFPNTVYFSINAMVSPLLTRLP